MRILFVISGLGVGGAERQVVQLARELVRRGNTVAIYTLTRHVPRRRELDDTGVTLIVDEKARRLDIAVLRRLRGTIDRLRPDIVHGFLFDGDLYARLAAAGTGIPVLNSERSSDYRLSPVQALAHRLTRGLASGVVANTWAGKAHAERLFGLHPDHVRVVPNGLRVDEIERQAANPACDVRREFFGDARCRVACLVGSIGPAKDYHLALASAARLIKADPAWRVLFIGDRIAAAGPYRPGPGSDTTGYKAGVLQHYERLGMQDRIRFAGVRNDVPALVRQCDVLYVTSAREGFPNSVLEAMALGVPVVSTAYSDIRRILPFEWQVVSHRAADDIARAVLRAYEEREAVVAAQRAWVHAHATIERAAAELEGVYRRYAEPASCIQPA